MCFSIHPALVSSSEEVRSRCHVKHTIPRWQTEVDQQQDYINGGQNNVRRQKSFDMLDQSAIAYARQQQHKVQHQVKMQSISKRQSIVSLQFRICFSFYIFLLDFPLLSLSISAPSHLPSEERRMERIERKKNKFLL